MHQLCFEVDTEPYATARDERVRQLAEQAGVKVFSPVSHTLYVGTWVLCEEGCGWQLYAALVEVARQAWHQTATGRSART